MTIVCPRCGALGYLERRRVKEQTYYYCLHLLEGKKVRKCYLGAGEYINVEKFQNLGLAGLTDKERFKRYLERIVEMLGEEDLRWLMKTVERRLGGK
jgi:hypothetical protein